MDPNVTLRNLIAEGLTAGISHGGEFRQAYNGWVSRGGFASRVELSPATDAWMMGDRFGEVIRVGTKYLHVKMDRSGRTLKVSPANVYAVLDQYRGI